MATSESAIEFDTTPRLDDRIVRRLGEQAGRLAFNGLRRDLGAHPESLSRALRRLEREGVVSRGSDGYSLADGYLPNIAPAFEPQVRIVASVDLPRSATRDQVFGALAGRWFARLRWVGVYERPEEPWLVWSVDGAAGHVLLTVRGRKLRIGIDDPDGGGKEALEESARELVVQGLGRLPRSAPRPSPTTVTFDLALDGRALHFAS